jgi:hypothetical protein
MAGQTDIHHAAPSLRRNKPPGDSDKRAVKRDSRERNRPVNMVGSQRLRFWTDQECISHNADQLLGPETLLAERLGRDQDTVTPTT